MADFLIIQTALARDPIGAPFVEFESGRVISDDLFDVASLEAQGVALVAYVPATMAAIVAAFRRQAKVSLHALLDAGGALDGVAAVEGWVETTGTSTVAGALENIAGCSFVLTLPMAARIKALMTFSASTTGGAPAVGAWAISINAIDGTELPRNLSGVLDQGIGAVQARSLILPAGPYTVQGRHRRVSGASTVNDDVAQLSARLVPS